MIAIKNVLVATDFEPASTSALAYGREIARKFGATMHVLHVVENLNGYVMGGEGAVMIGAMPRQVRLELEAAAREELRKALASADVSTLHARAVVETSGNAAESIVEYARENAIDLIVIGTHGRGAVGRVLMGSVADKVVRHAPCPVLAVKHPEHEFISTVAHAENVRAPM
jgi:nucleotide-binding universal stress UspA family protein